MASNRDVSYHSTHVWWDSVALGSSARQGDVPAPDVYVQWSLVVSRKIEKSSLQVSKLLLLFLGPRIGQQSWGSTFILQVIAGRGAEIN